MNCTCKTPCNPCRRDGRVEGERRKADALDLLAVHRESVGRSAQRALIRLLLDHGTATADDVRGLVDLPDGLNPKLFGATPSPLAKRGIIAADGFTRSCRPEAHARPITVWQLIDRSAAEQWLLAHPPLPAPDDTSPTVQGLLFDTQETAMPTAATAGIA